VVKHVQERTGKSPSFLRFALGLISGVCAGVLALLCASGYSQAVQPAKAVFLSNSAKIPVSQVHFQQGDTTNIAGSAEGWRMVRMRVTAYCPCERCCGRWADGYTANGHEIQEGDCFVAADKKYRFGTEMIVPGYNDGRAIRVLDRGGVIKGDRLDVFFPSHKQATHWGVKYLDVKVRVD
jgi:3D (Asp-Asp-Asp) domain-containing protein